MPNKDNWYIKGHVVSAKIWGEQTLKELIESNTAMINYLEDTSRPKVHAIINDEHLVSIPLGMFEMRKSLTYLDHPKLGWVVMLGDKKNLVNNLLSSILAKITRTRYIRVRTFDEALQHLRNVDPTIDWDAVSIDEHDTL